MLAEIRNQKGLHLMMSNNLNQIVQPARAVITKTKCSPYHQHPTNNHVLESKKEDRIQNSF